MRRFVIGTTALCSVVIEVEARTEAEALRKAMAAPTSQWSVGDIWGDVDLEEGTYEVTDEGPAR